MHVNSTSSKPETEIPLLSTTDAASKCSTCGEEFKTPLLAMVTSGFKVEEYHACPKCLSRVALIENQKKTKVNEVEEEPPKKEVEDNKEEDVGCQHRFGYLKQRSKKDPIPEECFTCAKMIDCISN